MKQARTSTYNTRRTEKYVIPLHCTHRQEKYSLQWRTIKEFTITIPLPTQPVWTHS